MKAAAPSAFVLQTDAARVTLTNVGAAIIAVEVPDRSGRVENVCLPLGDPSDAATPARYLDNPSKFGAVVGRFANRIGDASFAIDGKTYQLEANNGPNNLHSGSSNIAEHVWSVISHSEQEIVFQTTSPDGDGGFPGTLTVSARYTLEGSALTLGYEATVVGRATVVNLTNHAYWNLGGVPNSGVRYDVTEHVLQLHADEVLAADGNVLPTGERVLVDGTPFDFRTARPVGTHFEQQRGYDHCFVVRGEHDGTLRPVASIFDPESGRRLTMTGTQPGVQFYTANHFGGELSNNGFRAFDGFALEGENFPNSPNIESFPSAILRPGETYRENTRYAFSLDG